MFEQVGPEIWSHECIVRFGFIPLPHRMTIIRLANGRLFIHSPTKLTSQTRNGLAALGEVDYIGAPSWWHDMFLGEYVDAFPDAKLCGPLVLVKCYPRLSFEVILGGGPSPWQDEIDEFYVDQMRLFLDEFVFFHKRSRTLIVADLVHNLSDHAPVFTKWAYKLHGAYPGCSIPRFYRLAPKDRRHLRRCVDRILEWDFERLIVGHSNVIVDNPKACLRGAYHWL